MSKYYDYHTHSTNSFDGRITIDETCRRARERGAAGLTFTEHLSLTAREEIRPDYTRYAAEIAAARQAFPMLTIGMGLEVDLHAPRQAKIHAEMARGEWDFVLGSVHEVAGQSAYTGSFSAGRGKEEAYNLYFAEVLAQIQRLDCYDVLAHIDLIRRDQSFADRSLAYQDYAEALEPILQHLIAHGKGLEVNTAGWRYGLGEAHPSLSLLRRYRELGGEIITCGSDCHTRSSVFCDIEQGYALIQEAGFRYISLFTGRQLQQLKLT